MTVVPKRFTRDTAADEAKADLAERLDLPIGDIEVSSVTDTEFRDMSLGSAADGEMAAQMLVSGWKIELEAEGKPYEYRADKYQLRLHNFNGRNYVIVQ